MGRHFTRYGRPYQIVACDELTEQVAVEGGIGLNSLLRLLFARWQPDVVVTPNRFGAGQWPGKKSKRGELNSEGNPVSFRGTVMAHLLRQNRTQWHVSPHVSS